MKLFRNHIVQFVFIIIISFFFVNQQFSIIKDLDYNENKKKAERPEFDINRLDIYPNKYEDYFRDNFSLRGSFLKYMGWIYSHIWSKSPKPDKVIIGQNNWLYNVDKEFDCFCGKQNLDVKQLNDIFHEFLYRKRVLDSMGIKLLVVLNPTKYSIYPEYLPPLLSSNNKTNPAEQLIKRFRDSSDINIIYSKDILIPLKKENQLFYKSDTHWNNLAGYFVAKEIVNKIDMDIPEIPISKFRKDTIYNAAGNLAHMMANFEDFSETDIKFTYSGNGAKNFERFHHIQPPNIGFDANQYQQSFKSSNDSLPDAVIIMDSFGHALMPYLQNSFNHSTFIWDGWQYGFNLDIIKKEKPRVVIYMILESLIPQIVLTNK